MKYFFPNKSAESILLELPADIANGGNWTASDVPGGCIIYIGDPDEYKTKHVYKDYTYFSPKNLPSLVSIRKHEGGMPVLLECGKTIHIHPAYSTGRKVMFARKEDEIYINRYAQLAFNLKMRADDGDPLPVTDPEVQELVKEAIFNNYYMTTDLLDDMPFPTFTDITNIIYAAFGVIDPKKVESSETA